MTYQPLAEVRKVLRVKWYRSKIDHATLRNLSKRSDWQGWFQAGGHLALWLLTGSGVYFFWSQAMWFGFFIVLFIPWHRRQFFQRDSQSRIRTRHRISYQVVEQIFFFAYLAS